MTEPVDRTSPFVALDYSARVQRAFDRLTSHDITLQYTRTAAVLHTPIDELTLVLNATSGLNAIIHSIPLARGDEIIVTNHEYPDMLHDAWWDHACTASRSGCITLLLAPTQSGEMSAHASRFGSNRSTDRSPAI